jgi:hypothetical protein
MMSDPECLCQTKLFAGQQLNWATNNLKVSMTPKSLHLYHSRFVFVFGDLNGCYWTHYTRLRRVPGGVARLALLTI